MKVREPFPPLGELEQLVMERVWKHAPVTAREVCDRMKGRHARAYTTVMTTMDRLHRKGLLRREKEGLAWRYEAVHTREAFERGLADALASNILSEHGGETAVAAFVDAAADVDEALLERMRELIERKRKGRK